MAEAFRCSTASRARGDELAGTASTVRTFLLVEHPGPWGVDALRDARLPDGLGPALLATSRRARVRVLLVRRPGRAAAPDAGVRVFAARVAGGDSWLGTAVLDGIEQVADLDLPALASGDDAGLSTRRAPLLAVCTHGRHDACCAERGRPLAAALAADPEVAEQVWECSHVGGDRFAANLLVLPRGLYYGGIDAGTALDVARAHGAGQLALDHFRGRSDLPMAVQAAEVALRRRLGLTDLDGVVPEGRVVEGDLTTARFRVTAGDGADRAAEVVVRRVVTDEQHLLTCAAARASAVPRHEVVRLTVA